MITYPIAANGTRKLSRPFHGRIDSTLGPHGTVSALPAWPMTVLLWGFPLWWAAGAAPFAPIGIALVMIVLMAQRGRIRLTPGLLPWLVMLVWIALCAISLDTGMALIGFAQRFGNLAAIGVVMVYYVNARESLDAARVIRGLTAVWVTVVLLGLLAIQFPEFRLTTPVGAILPGSLTNNPLVYDLVSPQLAEVQTPWGAPEPFNRPSAPFPYANSWGVAFVVLTPVVLSLISSTRSRAARWLLSALVVIAFWPALETSNRGMFIGIAASVAYVTVRLAFRRRLIPVIGVLSVVGIGVFILLSSGAASAILGRQEYSDSTDGRARIYRETFEAVLQSPLIGYGAPRMDESIGISLGTQGYVWMLVFSYGLVGLGLFCFFLFGAIVRTWSVSDTSALWLHSCPVAAAVIMVFYSFDVMQMMTVALVIAILLRDRYFVSEVK